MRGRILMLPVPQIAASIAGVWVCKPGALVDEDGVRVAGHVAACWPRVSSSMEPYPSANSGIPFRECASARRWSVPITVSLLNAGWDEELLKLELQGHFLDDLDFWFGSARF